MVQVSITEMYDMATVKDKIGVVGIHTPSMQSIARRWHGLIDNHKFIKVVKCDISVACASVLPADPLQVGLSSDQIAPQDIMNPILYRACTNESWNTVLNKLYGGSSYGMSDSNSAKYTNDAFSGLNPVGHERIYYALLADGSWRKAMPQAGLTMHGLRPLVFPVLNAYGDTQIVSGQDVSTLNYPTGVISDTSGQPQTASGTSRMTTFRGSAQPMPRIPCNRPGSTVSASDDPYPYPIFELSDVPRTYVACILTPPNKSGNVMYYRMIIRWTIEFSDLVSVLEKETALDIASVGNNYYYTRTYTLPSSKLEDMAGDDDVASDTNSVETMNTDIDLVMEK